MLTELQRHWGPVRRGLMVRVLFIEMFSIREDCGLTSVVQGVAFKPPVYGAYSELYAGFSPEVKMEHNGGHTMAWGRLANLPDEVTKGLKSKSEGGTGVAQMFFDYCDREIKNFL